MSKRRCPIDNCCNTDCHRSQKEIIECKRVHEKILPVEELQKDIEELRNLKCNDDFIISTQLFNYMFGQCISAELLEKHNKILQRALELACDDLGLYEDVTSTQLKMRCYIDQAKKEN